MALVSVFTFFLLCHLLPILNSAQEYGNWSKTPPACAASFKCQDVRDFAFFFYNLTDWRCGSIELRCSERVTALEPGEGGQYYEGNQEFFSTLKKFLRVNDTEFKGVLESLGCDSSNNRSSSNSPSISSTVANSITLIKCLNTYNFTDQHDYQSYSVCSTPDCSVIRLPIRKQKSENNLYVFWLLSSPDCRKCLNRTRLCQNKKDGVHFIKTKADTNAAGGKKDAGKGSMKLILATAIPGAVLVFFLVLIIIIWRRKKWNNLSTYFIPRGTFSDVEDGSSYYGMPVFSYKELEEATHKFDPSKELGDGGFGTVYHGILRDGREVAVKRLYENNYKRVEQFMNEIHILTRLHHRNLVQLYGSTSQHSPKLLLVYEYIPNGTVADHLHGDKAQTEPLTWPVRMNIAIETATALSYLHKSDIIHRDVKTNNILLDNHFCVKVADFGLSRLFPNDVSHVSTAPQGTPGYVDPEYHQCYQLTDKSDVYSFGVVLIELISSLPAVDISRQRNEINLANLAVDRIQRCALDELIDARLGHDSDANIERMTTSVAELAFQCLQLEKDLRPPMDEVLNCLKQIQGVDGWRSGMQPPSPESENVILLKEKKLEESPVGVADKWISSRSTTPNTSTNG